MKYIRILSGFVLFFCVPTVFAAKNIILFIGDGMGQGIVTATRIKHYRPDRKMYIDTLPYTAIVKTYSKDSIVTDSAAAATAIACGEKVENGVLGQDGTAVAGQKDGKTLKCIAEIAKEKGKSVGLVTTTEITHATPAGFYAKVHHRDLTPTIASQLLASSFDVFLGGGKKYFDIDALKQNSSIDLKLTKEDLRKQSLTPDKVKKVVGLFADKHLSYELKRDQNGHEPDLLEMTLFAIESLRKNKKGFFLMVEGGRIDHALHGNLTEEALYEARQFDVTIGMTLERLNKSGAMKNTLILVTADHETGGLSINGYPSRDVDVAKYPHTTYASGPLAKASPRGALLLPPEKDSHSAYHTGIDVSLFAIGQGASEVHGTMENTDLFQFMKKHLK
ncbi:MAG: alkaline phosphatase [Bdellovibrionales bacterium]|nr:alkaline phosphatase [Bdellovibrionales bacterium]